MKNYPATHIRNIAIMGHSGAGKTSFAEACLYNAKLIDRLGGENHSVLDFDPEEIRRKISINTSCASMEWDNKKFTWIDTPGDFDFVGDALSALHVADCAIIIISAKSGVTVGAEKAVRYLNKAGIPFAFFINKMDDDHANYEKVMADLQEHFGTRVSPMMVPILENNKMLGFVNVFNGSAKHFTESGVLKEVETPSHMVDNLKGIFDQLMEHVAESNEKFMDKFFAGESFTEEETIEGIYECVHNAEIYPVFCGSANLNLGIRYTMSKLGDFMPTANKKECSKALNANDEEISLQCDKNGPLAATIFKTIADPFVGRISFFRVYSGTIHSNMTVYNPMRDKEERISGLSSVFGAKGLPADKIEAGDIGAVSKLSSSITGDTLCEKNHIIKLAGIEFPPPSFSKAVLPVTKGEEEKLSMA